LLAAAVVVALVTAAVWLWPRLPPRLAGAWPPTAWAAVECDVGQGDALVLRTGPDRAVLVDAGPSPEPVDSCLSRLGVHRLELIVLTHHHADHVDGLPGALHGRSVGGLLISPLAEPAQNAADVRRWAADDTIPVTVGWAGQSGDLGTDGWRLHWRILAPDLMPLSAGDGAEPDGTAVNESSVVSELEVSGPDGVIRVLALGDLEITGQQHLAQALSAVAAGSGGPGSTEAGVPVDVVRVAHHGSARQFPELYMLLRARIAVIGVGAGNDYGHPAPSVLTMLRAEGAEVFRTDQDGDVALVPVPDGSVRVVSRR
jgi:competence protein ComEC